MKELIRELKIEIMNAIETVGVWDVGQQYHVRPEGKNLDEFVDECVSIELNNCFA